MKRTSAEKAEQEAIVVSLRYTATGDDLKVILEALTKGWEPESLEKVLSEWLDDSEYLDVVEMFRDDIQPLLRDIVAQSAAKDVTGSVRECFSFYLTDAEQFLDKLGEKIEKTEMEPKTIPLDDHPDLVKMIGDYVPCARVYEIEVAGAEVDTAIWLATIYFDLIIDGTVAGTACGTLQIDLDEPEDDPIAAKIREIVTE